MSIEENALDGGAHHMHIGMLQLQPKETPVAPVLQIGARSPATYGRKSRLPLDLRRRADQCVEADWVCAPVALPAEEFVVEPVEHDAAIVARSTDDEASGVEHVAEGARGIIGDGCRVPVRTARLVPIVSTMRSW